MHGKDLKAVLRYGADLNDCRELLRHGSHSFFAASLLLPDEYCHPITALYAFCRIADDAIDTADDPSAGLEDLKRRLDKIYAGAPENDAVDRAFSDVVLRHRVPKTLPLALLEGFEWDVIGRRYESMSDTYAYAARVAGTVGAMMAILLGVRNPGVLSRACDLGVAMQLTNIARDVGEDARQQRLYLPVETLAKHGVDAEAWMQKPKFNPGIEAAVRELLTVADGLYERAEWGIAQLPARVRPGIFAARTIYAEIGREIERRGCDSVNQRAVVGRRRKIRLLLDAVRMALSAREEGYAPPLAETRFLIDACRAVR
ncbi:MAG: phytoene/squalene synthase family protein [Pseudomonadota bacterium]